MAVIVYTAEPTALLTGIRSAVEAGRVATWSVDADGDFTHSPEQWRFQAWFRPKLLDGKVIFLILAPQNTDMSKITYAVYHGRFVEMLLAHFDEIFETAVATALPAEGDSV